MGKAHWWHFIILAILLTIFPFSQVQAFVLHVVDENGTGVGNYRYVVEEDTTYPVNPGEPVTDSLSLNITKYYSPVIANGDSADPSSEIALPADTRYYVSVLPYAGYSLGGNQVALGQTDVTVVVHSHPIPTAQISVYAFHDNQPINGAKDIPAEPGLAGFTVIVKDFAGQDAVDAFGNPLGTTYQQNPDGSFILDLDGNPQVEMMGDGVIVTDATGEVLIKYLAPGKYAVEVIPPAGQEWIQTASLEGTKANDAWVRAGEPRFTAEFGVLNWLVFFGFVQPMEFPPPSGNSSAITGQVVYVHENHPPYAPGLFSGAPVPNAWVGLNNLSGADEQVFTAPCDPVTGDFVIENVPPGLYQLAVWDAAIDAIIDFRGITVPAEGGPIDLQQVPVYAWFGNFEGSVFSDNIIENGFRDEMEIGIPGQAINLRFPDGSMYKTTATNMDGSFQIAETFPFFRFLVAEVDFASLKATGATFRVDDGGEIPVGETKLNPQPQPENGGLGWRTETGPVLTTAMKLYSGQTNEAHYGKNAYALGENGGISGIVYYSTTRAENDPAYAAGEEWEPGIPNVQVNLYEDFNLDGEPDGPSIMTAFTDSWDDSLPSGCVYSDPLYRPEIYGQLMTDCAENIRTWNQIRPGVFNGGYAFGPELDDGSYLPSGTYIVEVVPPPGYFVIREEDKNVDLGDQFIPFFLPPPCVGADHEVLPYLSLQTDELGNPLPGVDPADLIEAPFAGDPRPLCNRKQIVLTQGRNAAVDFNLATFVPVAGRLWGWVTDDLQLEFDPNSPNKGANFAPSWLPISFRDFRGNEVARVYADEWGKFNAMVPSTYTVNVPSPTGVSPNMVLILPNDPGPIPDPMNPGQFITDPWYNPAYGQEFGETWEFYPGKTTHVDTIVIPIAAMTSSRLPLDCQFPDQTPIISSANVGGNGPYAETTPATITLLAVGDMIVPNPDYDPSIPGSEPTIVRDYGFGGAVGSVRIGNTPLTNLVWAADGLSISATIPAGTTTGQLTVTRGDNGVSSILGITVHIGPANVIRVLAGQKIQDAINIARDGDLIIVAPGVYEEHVVLWKRVKLQGWGAYSTFIDAFHAFLDPVKLTEWQTLIDTLTAAGQIEFVEGQTPDFAFEAGAGITVATRSGRFTQGDPAIIDGFGIKGNTELGGGILVNAFARFLRIGNCKIETSQGSLGGGIRVGTPSIVNAAGTGFVGSENQGIRIHHNHIAVSGSRFGSGGGIAIYKGADGYQITDNWICGCHAFVYGGGIAHFGLSNQGLIQGNVILNNEAFDEGGGILLAGELVPAGAPAGTLTEGAGDVIVNANVIHGNKSGDDGAGIRTLLYNGQDVVAAPGNPAGWHRLLIFNNMITNNSSADVGGGLSFDDTARAFVIHNTIAYNDATSTGVDAFGGPCFEFNEVGAPVGQWCPEEGGTVGGITTSIPQVGGIASKAHSTGLQDAFGPLVAQEYSDPWLINNIIWQNRSFYWDAAYGVFGGIRPDVPMGEPPVYWDLWVYGTAAVEFLNPMYCVITDATGYHASNTAADPSLIDAYVNVYQATSKGAAFGNFVTVAFEPLGLRGNYHISSLSPIINAGLTTPAPAILRSDIDGEVRPNGPATDIGADEFYP